MKYCILLFWFLSLSMSALAQQKAHLSAIQVNAQKILNGVKAISVQTTAQFDLSGEEHGKLKGAKSETYEFVLRITEAKSGRLLHDARVYDNEILVEKAKKLSVNLELPYFLLDLREGSHELVAKVEVLCDGVLLGQAQSTAFSYKMPEMQPVSLLLRNTEVKLAEWDYNYNLVVWKSEKVSLPDLRYEIYVGGFRVHLSEKHKACSKIETLETLKWFRIGENDPITVSLYDADFFVDDLIMSETFTLAALKDNKRKVKKKVGSFEMEITRHPKTLLEQSYTASFSKETNMLSCTLVVRSLGLLPQKGLVMQENEKQSFSWADVQLNAKNTANYCYERFSFSVPVSKLIVNDKSGLEPFFIQWEKEGKKAVSGAIELPEFARAQWKAAPTWRLETGKAVPNLVLSCDYQSNALQGFTYLFDYMLWPANQKASYAREVNMKQEKTGSQELTNRWKLEPKELGQVQMSFNPYEFLSDDAQWIKASGQLRLFAYSLKMTKALLLDSVNLEALPDLPLPKKRTFSFQSMQVPGKLAKECTGLDMKVWLAREPLNKLLVKNIDVSKVLNWNLEKTFYAYDGEELFIEIYPAGLTAPIWRWKLVLGAEKQSIGSNYEGTPRYAFKKINASVF